MSIESILTAGRATCRDHSHCPESTRGGQSFHRRQVAAVVIFAALGSPALAAETITPVEACSKAFWTSVPERWREDGGAELKFLNRGYVPTEAEYAATVLSYDLIALRSGTAQTIARATCKVDDTGRVTALKIDSAFAKR